MTALTESQFRDHDNLRKELAEFLAKPSVALAIQIIEDKARPRYVPEPRLHAHLDTLMSQQYYKILGIQYAIDSLMRLTRPNPTEITGNEEEDPFFHALPEPMKIALKEKREQGL